MVRNCRRRLPGSRAANIGRGFMQESVGRAADCVAEEQSSLGRSEHLSAR